MRTLERGKPSLAPVGIQPDIVGNFKTHNFDLTRTFATARQHRGLGSFLEPLLHVLERAGRGTLAWVIKKFTDPEVSQAWRKIGESTREVYMRHLDWLRENDGGSMLAAFDKKIVRGIRNQFVDKPTVGNAILKRLSQLWHFAEETLSLDLPTNPVREVQKLEEEREAAWVWSEQLIEAYETDCNETDLTFYFLARYTGQRKGDCCDMKWTDFDAVRKMIYVVQEKTGRKIWVPCHDRLFNYLSKLEQRGKHILVSPVTGQRYAKQSITNYVTARCTALGYQGWSAHGLRHSAGMALAEAECTTQMIMAILGHVTEKQAAHYQKQASQLKLAKSGIAKWNVADEATKDIALPVAKARKREYKATKVITASKAA